ncbi:ubiquitin carboxyl-terminal hydrolase 17-like protein B [Thrips palmi]|uniref:Ubiquitin carboxyl-terminal hydrolase 36 n=1 Tax=Thrips palmi TaxID=161013 RepID=A0A6P8YQB0_THRPL|nr:ubiquitin carboxyl-terminal hydrolase 17-like protein B [Thrips palmi]
MWFNCDPPNPTRILYQNDVAVTWQGVTPVYGGLVNLNNSCFLNASVQALMHLPGFVKFLAEDIAHRKGCFTLLNCVVCALNRTHLNMSLHAAFRPIGLLNLLPKLSPLLKRGRQEDADEFIVALLDKVTEELILREGGPANVDFCSRQTTAVGQIFGWWSRTEGKCGDCSTSTLTYAPQTSLSLPLDDSVQSAINVRLKEVEIVEDFTCIRKCLKRVAFQTVDFYSYPKVLRIVLNRFDNDSYKRSQPVSVEKSIVIGDATYSFVSCVLHDGNTATEGHYTCLATRHDGKLVFINDAEISEAKGLFGLNSPKCKREVYVLFYQFHHMKVHSIKRALAKTPSNALSPLRKKIHSSPMKRSLEKRGKKLTFSPKKFKRKVGSLMHSILPSKPKLFKGDDILAKPLPEKKESWIMKLACNRGMSDEEVRNILKYDLPHFAKSDTSVFLPNHRN